MNCGLLLRFCFQVAAYPEQKMLSGAEKSLVLSLELLLTRQESEGWL